MRTIRFGSEGPDVEWLQRFLGLRDDGIFGHGTFAAVVRYQQQNGLIPDGIVGQKTWQLLKPGSIIPEPEPANVRGSFAWYLKNFREMRYDKGFEFTIRSAAERVARGKDRYRPVAAKIGCPWYFVGGLHSLEGSCDFTRVLHNGQRIIGTGRLTTIEPKGCGPFDTWEAAAIDALKIKNYHVQKSWGLAEMLSRAEKFNGVGVLLYHAPEMTAYLWAQSSINDDDGKYIADGKWSDSANANGQTGFAVLLRELSRMGEIELPDA